MIRHFFLDKTNSIISKSEQNLGLNPILNVSYGDGVTRSLIHFDVEKIKCLIDENRLDEAITELTVVISKTPTDVAFYLRGNAFRKLGDWKRAIGDYCSAMELNPDSPAAEAYKAAIAVLDYRNTDLLNP